MKITIGQLRHVIRESIDSGMFKKGDHILFGKYKNNKGKIIDIFLDDKDHPTIEIEPISTNGKKKKKNVTSGLYKIWKSDEDFSDE